MSDPPCKLKPAEIAALLAEQGFRHKSSLGQNFLLDPNLLGAIVRAGEVSASDCILEVGTGAGSLTRELVDAGAGRVVTVEVDPRLPSVARKVIGTAGETRVHFVEGDVLVGKGGLHPGVVSALEVARAEGFRSYKLVANLPYAVATPLVLLLLEPDGPVRPPRAPELALMAVTVQREVAERLTATRITKAYGLPSVLVQALARVEALRRIGPKAFRPAPKVESAMVRVEPRGEEERKAVAEVYSTLRHIVRVVFRERRKKLRNALRHGFPEREPALVETALAAAGVDGDARVEELAPESFMAIATAAKRAGLA